MTPSSEYPRSGNPAKQAELNQTVKQQREARRQEKLAEYQRELSRRTRGKAVWWTVGSVAAVAVIGLVVASIVLTPKPLPAAEYTAGGSGAEIEGVEKYQHATEHVAGTVEYEQTPPAGGPHNNVWLTCAVYDEPQENELAVHSMEHGAVWLTYDPEKVDADGVRALRALMPSSYAILSPYPGMDTAVAVSGWNTQLKVDAVDDPRIAEFFEEYWRSASVPEPGASCSGVEGPGRV